jgi:tetratricopeptide (TPR) repeat protein
MTRDTVAVRLTSAMPPVRSSSPTTAVRNNAGGTAVQNNAGGLPVEAVAKKDHKVVTAPLSQIVVPRRTPTSSPVPQQTTRAHRAVVPRVAVAVAGDSTRRTVDEMAAYQIRLGDAYMSLGEYDKALTSFSIAIAFAPDNKEAEEKVKRARRAKTAEENVLQ